ncbi:hypothetical protein RMATCC62417_13796 [Rhizopus microsporus]|nr:hypothetical protein RMATCC62417_13796 [Rhizopus microsporus]
MALGKLDKYIVNGTDVALEFKKFQTHSIEALFNILLVDKTTNPKLLPNIVSKETYRLMKQEFIRNHMRNIKFNEKIYKRVKRILEKYFVYETNDESDEDIRETNNESRIELLKLAKKSEQI